MRKGESIGKHVETPAKRIKIIPWASSMGGENGKNRLGSRSLRSDPSREKAAGRRTKLGRTFSFLIGRNGHDGSANASPDPLLLAPDPMSWHITHQTGHNLGSYHFFLLPASPGPSLLASDPFSLAHRIQDTTAHRQLQYYKLMVQ